jgi:hypothetical protein
MRRCVPAIMASLLLPLSLPVFAAYKCDVNGTVVYSDQPCAAGKQTQLAAPAAVSEKDATDAASAARRDKAELTRLESERRKREAADEKRAAQARREAAMKERKCGVLAQRVKWAEEDASRAAGKSAAKAERRKRRAKEAYELQCTQAS